MNPTGNQMVVNPAPAWNIHNKPDHRTRLKKMMDEADTPNSVLVCPYGCGSDDVDMLGYCRHLIGFTNAPLPEGPVRSANGYKVDDVLGPPDPVLHRRSVVRRDKDHPPVPLEVGDYLVRATTSSRVYRSEPLPLSAVTHEPAKRPGTNPVTAPANPAPTATPQDTTQTHPQGVDANVSPQENKPSTTDERRDTPPANPPKPPPPPAKKK